MKFVNIFVSHQNIHFIFCISMIIEHFKYIPGYNFSEILNREVVCSGIYGGHSKVIRKLGQMMKALYRNVSDFVTKDQVFFDYLYYSGAMKTAGINPVLTTKYISAWWTIGKMKLQPVGHISIYNVTPPVVHQINRNEEYLQNAHEVCHVPYVPKKKKKSLFTKIMDKVSSGK